MRIALFLLLSFFLFHSSVFIGCDCFMVAVNVGVLYTSSIIANVICLCHGIAIGWLSPNLPKLEAKDSPLESGPLTLSEKSWVRNIASILLSLLCFILFYYFCFDVKKSFCLAHTHSWVDYYIVAAAAVAIFAYRNYFFFYGCLDWIVFFNWSNSWQLCLWYSIELCWTKEYTLHIGTTKSGKKALFCLFIFNTVLYTFCAVLFPLHRMSNFQFPIEIEFKFCLCAVCHSVYTVHIYFCTFSLFTRAFHPVVCCCTFQCLSFSILCMQYFYSFIWL